MWKKYAGNYSKKREMCEAERLERKSIWFATIYLGMGEFASCYTIISRYYNANARD